SGATLSGWKRALWIAILLWLALRSAFLLFDVVTMPLYPWDAWIQWATKARVWFELGHMVSFERSDSWFNAGGSAWCDAAPPFTHSPPLRCGIGPVNARSPTPSSRACWSSHA